MRARWARNTVRMTSPVADAGASGRTASDCCGVAAATANGNWIVLRTLPHAANTDATRPGGGGSFFADVSAVMIRIAERERWRPFTHQESCTLTPGEVGWPAPMSTPARINMDKVWRSGTLGSSGPSENPGAEK